MFFIFLLILSFKQFTFDFVNTAAVSLDDLEHVNFSLSLFLIFAIWSINQKKKLNSIKISIIGRSSTCKLVTEVQCLTCCLIWRVDCLYRKIQVTIRRKTKLKPWEQFCYRWKAINCQSRNLNFFLIPFLVNGKSLTRCSIPFSIFFFFFSLTITIITLIFEEFIYLRQVHFMDDLIDVNQKTWKIWIQLYLNESQISQPN